MTTIDTFASALLDLTLPDRGIRAAGVGDGIPTPVSDLDAYVREFVGRSMAWTSLSVLSVGPASTSFAVRPAPARTEDDSHFIFVDGTQVIGFTLAGASENLATAAESEAHPRWLADAEHLFVTSDGKAAYSLDYGATISSFSAAGYVLDAARLAAGVYLRIATDGTLRGYTSLANLVTDTSAATPGGVTPAAGWRLVATVGRVLAWGASGAAYSTDGATFSARTSWGAWQDIVAWRGQFWGRLTASPATLWSSFDGQTWTQQSTAEADDYAFDEAALISAGSVLCLTHETDGDLVSLDGSTWSEQLRTMYQRTTKTFPVGRRFCYPLTPAGAFTSFLTGVL